MPDIQEDKLLRVFSHFLALVDAFRGMESNAHNMQQMAEKNSLADGLFTGQEDTWSLAGDWLASEIRNQANQHGVDLSNTPKFIIKPIEPIPF